MFINNPMGLVVKGMMEELREDGEISNPGWESWLKDKASKVRHAFNERRHDPASQSECEGQLASAECGD